MRSWLRVLRGLSGLGAIGAVLGGGFVAILTAVADLMSWGTLTSSSLIAGTLAGAVFGLSVTTGFGILLAATSKGRGLEELSLWRASAMSAVVGASLPVLLVSVISGAVVPLASMSPAIVIGGLFGALLGGGLVAVGKEARGKELKTSDSQRRLAK